VYDWTRPGSESSRPIKMPAAGWLHSTAVYEAMVTAAVEAGFDFVKVDDQAQNIDKYAGVCNAVAKGAENQQALERSCALHTQGLINCMAHNPVCIFNTARSAVTRCSEDYLLGSLEQARRHLHNSYLNMAVLGPTVWGDHDMFHSNDPVAGGIMARSKALSGGPVYLSDNPERFAAEHVRPLCFEDGRLLRPLAPAVPLPESVMLDPFAEARAFRAIAPLPGGAAAVLCYNLTEPEQTVDAWVQTDDYVHAGAMLDGQRDWPEAHQVLLYDADAERAQLGGSLRRPMPAFGDWLVMLCPVRHGWAVIGREDKFLSPVGCDVLFCDGRELILNLPEPGPLRIWRAGGSVACDRAVVSALGGGLWRLDPEAQAGALTLRIRKES
jgi:hypothetical protein